CVRDAYGGGLDSR
nr:immunoglobulin heavy chain junction region [Macaca mulatta]